MNRRWISRAAAILLPVWLVCTTEGLCRLTGWGRPALTPDPFVGFSAIHPLFEVDAERSLHRIAPSRRKFFAYDSFPLDKPTGSRRAFCLGGSTVKGEPYSIPTAFTTWLELAINVGEPDHPWDVINCGGISYASYRLIPILQECLTYQPDLFILCTGHNEFLEDRTYGHLKDLGVAAAASRTFAGRSHLVTLVRDLLPPVQDPAAVVSLKLRPQLGPETDPILDYHDSLQAYHWDDDWRRGVVAHYEFNLRRMLDFAAEAGVPVLLVLPPSNLGGCPPFKSESHPPLSAKDEQQWSKLMASARASYAVDRQQSLRDLQHAAEINPGSAETLYDLGQCCVALARFDEARRCLIAARDNDVVPLRMISELEAVLRRVARERNVPLLDAHQLLERQTPRQLLDDSLLVDHIHPGFDGHQMIAAALARLMDSEGLTDLADDWETLGAAAWKQHFNALDYTYFAQGQRMLRSLEGWTQGRGNGPPAAERFPWRIRAAETTTADSSDVSDGGDKHDVQQRQEHDRHEQRTCER
ncbi:MAG: tetratricopeptide repeat protein [Planctomycetaceae bacterium]